MGSNDGAKPRHVETGAIMKMSFMVDRHYCGRCWFSPFEYDREGFDFGTVCYFAVMWLWLAVGWFNSTDVIEIGISNLSG